MKINNQDNIPFTGTFAVVPDQGVKSASFSNGPLNDGPTKLNFRKKDSKGTSLGIPANGFFSLADLIIEVNDDVKQNEFVEVKFILEENGNKHEIKFSRLFGI